MPDGLELRGKNFLFRIQAALPIVSPDSGQISWIQIPKT
jgi:hypothetical protein